MANRMGYTAATKFQYLDQSDFCDHTSYEDHSKAVGYFYEEDSFGLVGALIVCAECRDKTKEQEGNEKVVCHDCRMTVLHKNVVEWKWYDFDFKQGDEPTIVCNDCCVLPTHIARVDNDNANYRQEMGHDDSDDDTADDEEQYQDDEDRLLGM